MVRGRFVQSELGKVSTSQKKGRLKLWGGLFLRKRNGSNQIRFDE